MPRPVRLWMAFWLALFLSFPGVSAGQVRLESRSFKLGLRSEYLALGLKAGEGGGSPHFNSYLTCLSLSYELKADANFTLLLGYSASGFQELVFRQLPFSIDFEGQGVGGFLAGAEVSKGLFTPGRFEVNILGRFLACIGLPKKYDVPGLAVPGSVEANPSWMRVLAGPVLSLTGGERLRPYFAPCFHTLWGTFSMNQTVNSLQGEEKKEIKSKGQVALLAGAFLDLGRTLELRAEAVLYPRQGGSDYSVLVQVLFGF